MKKPRPSTDEGSGMADTCGTTEVAEANATSNQRFEAGDLRQGTAGRVDRVPVAVAVVGAVERVAQIVEGELQADLAIVPRRSGDLVQARDRASEVN